MTAAKCALVELEVVDAPPCVKIFSRFSSRLCHAKRHFACMANDERGTERTPSVKLQLDALCFMWRRARSPSVGGANTRPRPLQTEPAVNAEAQPTAC